MEESREQRNLRSQDSDKCEGLLESVYNPNPEWMGQTGLVDSRANAKVLAPQFLKQAQESAKNPSDDHGTGHLFYKI